jgi:hypothetical protein
VRIALNQRKYTPVVVVDLCLRTKELLLTRLLGPVSPHQVAVLLGLQHGDQVDARPHLLARELAGFLVSILLYSFLNPILAYFPPCSRAFSQSFQVAVPLWISHASSTVPSSCHPLQGWVHRSLLFPNSLANSVETVAADARHCDQVVGGAETADGQVAAVLHGLVAAGRRHVLRHLGRWRSSAELCVGIGGERFSSAQWLRLRRCFWYLVRFEVQWLLTTAGWPGSGSSSGEALALLARGRTQNVVTIEPHLIAIYISH